MALKPIGVRYITKLVCDLCAHMQDEVSIPTEQAGEEITYTCPVCHIGEMRYEQLPIVKYVDEEDD